jgi:hypothetical protein
MAQFINQPTFFAQGLTQKQENNPNGGGYDVSINCYLPDGQERRLIFLQYKSGVRKKYCTNPESKFYRQTSAIECRSPEHVLFTFNDAANGTQHSTLRNLANSANANISPNSVYYVFPRITEILDFKNKFGNLIYYTSFIPVLDIDLQALNQCPPINNLGDSHHKFRTSYDGAESEVNFFFFLYFYNKNITYEILSELICIQIERLVKIMDRKGIGRFEIIQDDLRYALDRFIKNELKENEDNDIIKRGVTNYIDGIERSVKSNKPIPKAPSEYTSIIPKEGLKISLEDKNDFSLLSYQIF